VKDTSMKQKVSVRFYPPGRCMLLGINIFHLRLLKACMHV